jgi:hypothetical protein
MIRNVRALESMNPEDSSSKKVTRSDAADAHLKQANDEFASFLVMLRDESLLSFRNHIREQVLCFRERVLSKQNQNPLGFAVGMRNDALEIFKRICVFCIDLVQSYQVKDANFSLEEVTEKLFREKCFQFETVQRWGPEGESMRGTCYLDIFFLELLRFEDDAGVGANVFVDCGVGKGLPMLTAITKNMLFSSGPIFAIGFELIPV